MDIQRFPQSVQSVALAPTPFGVLCALARQPGSLLTKHALLDQVWGHRFVSDSVLKTAISDLRTVLEDDPRQPRYIETVARRGYRFIAATTTPYEASPQASAHSPPMEAAGAREPRATPFVGREAELARRGYAWSRTLPWWNTSGTRVGGAKSASIVSWVPNE